MRILHFSDFHLAKSQRERAVSLINRMISSLQSINREQQIDLIIFSGDLVDQGGKEYNSLTEAFEDFQEVVIKPLCNNLGLNEGRFIFVPGNHDVNQKSDTEAEEMLMYEALTSLKEIDNFMHNRSEVKKINRIKEFNKFQEQFLKSCDAKIQHTDFQTNLLFEINHETVAITCLNTAWRCYNSKNDKNRIVMGKSQVTDSEEFIGCADIKIAVGHHYYEFLNKIERDSVANVIAKQYDLFMGGHTHEREGRFEVLPGGSCLFLTASGTVYSNISDKEYKNGYILVDFLNIKREVQIRWYKQCIDESFSLDFDYGENGVNTISLKGYPILRPLKSSLLKKLWSNGYEKNSVADSVTKELIDKKNKTLQLVALSGLGKTRILFEAFSKIDLPKNAFYCDYSDRYEGIVYEVEHVLLKYEEGLIILDNCPNNLFKDVIDRRDSYNPEFRLIGINNEYFDRLEINPLKCKQIFLDHKDFKDCVDSLVDREMPVTNVDASIREKIKKIADNFPGMACDLITGYKEVRTVDIHTVDAILAKLLKLETGCEKEQMIAMETLALFQPCPYREINREAYEFVRDNNNITPLYRCEKPEKRKLFNDVITRYSNSLIDNTKTWVNVRPLPLAVWLVGKWFERCDEERLDDVLKDLKTQPDNVYQILRDGLGKRIEYMQDNNVAQELFIRLTSKEGSFYNEKVICSDMGSRLFLAISSVNPVTRSVAKCLYDNLFVKDIEWIRENVKDDVKYNLVWALEKLCFDGKSYKYAVKVLALFAVAENETYGNNALGQIKQLFHIQLPGTQASLKERLLTIKELSTMGYDYVKLTMDILDQAWINGHFYRSGFGDQFGLEKLTDYQPKSNKEIIDYWVECSDIMQGLIDQYEVLLDYAADIVKKHIFRWSFDGMLQRMMPLINKIAERKSFVWNDAWQELTRCKKKHEQIYPKDFIQSWDSSIASLAPKFFVGKLREARNIIYDKDSLSTENMLKLKDDLFSSLVMDFVQKEIYKDSKEVKAILNDKEFNDYTFYKKLAEMFNTLQLDVFFDVLLDIIKDEGGDKYNNSMYFMLCHSFKCSNSIFKFFDQLLHNGYKNLYLRTTAHCETEKLNIYSLLKNKYEQGEIEASYAEDYLTIVSISTKEQIIATIIVYNADHPELKQSLMNFIIKHRFMYNGLSNEIYNIVKSYILDYEIIDERGHQNYEYARFVIELLEEHHDDDFASMLIKKVIDDLNCKYLHGNLEGIVSVLLKQYTDVVWDDFERAFVSDNYISFWFQIRHELGSGSGFGSGPLFQLDEERIKNLCLKYPDKAPVKISEMIPVFKYDDNSHVNGFGDLFIWMLDNFGNNKDVLSGLHANLGTFGWTGSVIPLIQQKKECFERIESHPRPEVRRWVSCCLTELEEDYRREDNREQYMRLRYQ